MPNTRSAAKHIKTSKKRQVANRAAKNRIIKTRKKLYRAIGSNDKKDCVSIFRTYCSLLDKAVKKGVIKANAANRRKSRAEARLAAG